MRFPEVPSCNVGISVNLTYTPPRLDVFIKDDIIWGDTINGRQLMFRDVMAMKGHFRDHNTGSKHILAQILSTEGLRWSGFCHTFLLPTEIPPPSTGNVGVDRGVSQDSNERPLETGRDAIDDILQKLGFTEPDEWFAGGQGSLTTLRTRVKEICEQEDEEGR